jgi:RHS repeat-associated protein
MTQVSMPRVISGTTVTQTRTFNYSLTTGRLTSATNPESGTVSYVYNTDGTVQSRTDARGQKVAYTYNSLGQVTQKSVYPDGVNETTCARVTYTYDTYGRLSSHTWGCTSATQFTESNGYGTGNLVTQRTLQATRLLGSLPQTASQTIAFSYNNEGTACGVGFGNVYRIVNINGGYYPQQQTGPSFSCEWDTMKRPVRMYQSGTPQLEWARSVTYNAAGQMTQMEYPVSWHWTDINNTVKGWEYYRETRTYNVQGQLTQIQNVATEYDGSYTPRGFTLQYSYSGTANDGRITQMVNSLDGETINYQYDSLGRLTQAETAGTEWGQTYSYDGFGNLTAEVATKGTAPTTYLNYDTTKNRILATGHTYDAAGNLTALPTQTLTYDVESRVTQVVDTVNGTQQYGYNGLTQRVYQKTGSDSESVSMYGPGGERYDFGLYWVNGNLKITMGDENNVYLLGRQMWDPKAWPNGTGITPDRLGTTAISYGRVSGSRYPYGEIKSTGASGQMYATYPPTNTPSLFYAMNRYYSSQIMRFTSPDPAAPSDATDPQSWNLYAYVQGDPINRYDPTGLDYEIPGGGSFDPSDPRNVAPGDTSITVTGSVVHWNGVGGRHVLTPTRTTWKEEWAPSFTPYPPCVQPPHPGVGDDQIAKMIAEAKAHDGNPIELAKFLVSKFAPSGDWDYKSKVDRKQQPTEYAEAMKYGNFAFGATMAGLGLSYYQAQNAAGIAQIFIMLKGGAAGDPTGIPLLSYPYGDQKQDAMQIKSGWNYEHRLMTLDCP